MSIIQKATHEGKIILTQKELDVAVLENGIRIITKASIFKAFEKTRRGRVKNDLRARKKLSFVDTQALINFIDDELEKILTTIHYKSLKNNNTEGYDARIVPKLCHIYVKANKLKKLSSQQESLAKVSELLLSDLLGNEIKTLIDDTTNYSYKKEFEQLEKTYQKYLCKELLPWQNIFPIIFHKELFRLNGWDFVISEIEKKPEVMSTWTKTLIYDELAEGVLNKLKEVNINESTSNSIEKQCLEVQIHKIITLFELSENMEHMWQLFKKLKLKQRKKLNSPYIFNEKGHTIEPIEDRILSDFNKKLKIALNYNPKK